MQLIVLFPIYSSMAFADIEFNFLGGKTGADGYRAVTDITLINATSTTPYVIISGGPNLSLDCVPNTDASLYHCSYSTEEFELENPSSAPIAVGIQEVDSAGNPLDGAQSEVKYMTIDSTLPYVEITNVSQKGSGQVGLAYSASDEKSGLYVLQFYLEGELVGEKNFSGQISADSGEISFNTTKTGPVIFYAIAIDRVNNVYTSQNFNTMLDFSAPSVDGTFKIYLGDEEVKFVSRIGAFANFGGLQNVILKFVIQDENLDAGSLKGNLNEINTYPATEIYYREAIKGYCEAAGNMTYDCGFNKDSSGQPLKLYPAQDGISINITVNDAYGNIAEKTLTSSLSIDEETPYATFIGTENCADSKCFFKAENNVFIAKIYNTGALFDYKWVYFDLSSVATGDNITPWEVQIDKCDGSGEMTCYSTNLSAKYDLVSGEVYSISISPKSIDDAGNVVTTISDNIIYDAYAPTITYSEVNSSLGNDYLMDGDDMIITLSVDDSVSGVKSVWADLSDAVDGATDVEAICVNDDDDSNSTIMYDATCTITSGPAGGGPKTSSLIFKLEDNAGNIANYTINQDIYGIANESANLWYVASKDLRPPYYDAAIMQYLGSTTTEWADINLQSRASGVTILSVTLDACIASTNSSVIGGSSLKRGTRTKENRITDSGVVTIATDLSGGLTSNNTNETATSTVASVDYSCTMQIVSVYNMNVYPKETINVSISVPVTSTGFDLPADYDARLEDLKDKLENWEWIDTVQDVLEISQKTCTAGQNAVKTLELAGAVLSSAGAIFKASGYTWATEYGKALQGVDDNLGTGLFSQIGDIFSWVCAFAQCDLMNKLEKDKDWNDSAFATFLKNYYNATSTYINSLDHGFSVNDDGAFSRLSGGMDKVSGTNDNVDKNPDPMGRGMIEASKKSIVISVAAFCIPGVIYNLEKARAIDCRFYNCLKDDVAAGQNPYMCQVSRAYAYCKFVYGSIFYAIPFSGFLDSITGAVDLFSENILAGVAGIGSTYVCKKYATQPTGTSGALYVVCRTTKYFNMGVSLYDFWDGLFSGDYYDSDSLLANECDKALG